MENRYTLIAICHFGLEAILKKEITDLGLEIVSVEDGRITFAGDASAIPRANVIEAIKEDLWIFFSTRLPRKAADIPRKKIAKLKAHSTAPFEKPM